MAAELEEKKMAAELEKKKLDVQLAIEMSKQKITELDILKE
jgi:hypothetical protein